MLDTLTTVVAGVRDTVVADTTVANTVIVVGDFLQGTFPWLSAQAVNWLAKFLGAIPIVGVLFGWSLFGRLLNYLSPMIRLGIGKKLEKYSWLVNLLLGAFIGGAMGDASMGLVATGVWKIIRGVPLGTTSIQGLVKAKNVALLLLCGLILASPARAAEPTVEQRIEAYNKVLVPQGLKVVPVEAKVKVQSNITEKPKIGWLAKERFTLAFGAGNRWETRGHFTEDHAFGAAQLGYGIWDHVGVRTRVDRDFRWEENNWNFEASTWLIF